jgi:hydrogenase maturation factor
VTGGGLPTGKLPANLLREVLQGAPLPPEVLLGPALGEDACAIAVPAGVLIAASDPITLTGSRVGAHAVVINANDVAMMGVEPRWFLAVMLLPEGTTAEDVRALFRETRDALKRVGACLVGGHTEVTPAVRQVVVVGQFLGISETGRFVRTGGVEAGDVVLQVGPAPVEGAAVLAAEAEDRLGSVPAAELDRALRAVEEPQRDSTSSPRPPGWASSWSVKRSSGSIRDSRSAERSVQTRGERSRRVRFWRRSGLTRPSRQPAAFVPEGFP